MKLWLLLRKDHVDWDQYVGFVVRAETAKRARQIAWEGTDQQEKYREPYWLDTSAVLCIQIQIEGKEEILLYSFRAG